MEATEAQARNKWCPFARLAICPRPGESLGPFSHPQIVTCNRVQTGLAPDAYYAPTGSLCMASQCMAWHWSDPEIDTMENHSRTQAPEGEGWVLSPTLNAKDVYAGTAPELPGRPRTYVWERPVENRRGFCGMSGV